MAQRIKNQDQMLANLRQRCADYLEEVSRLLTLNGENPFKIRAFEKASRSIQDIPSDEELYKHAQAKCLTDLEGIGKGIAEVLDAYILSSSASARDDLKKQLPHGLLELTAIPGVGPKKARDLIEQLKITSVGELEYACRENRLLSLKGFGDKVQEKILKAIQFQKKSAGMMRLCDADDVLARFFEAFGTQYKRVKAEAVGEVRRRCEVIRSYEVLILEENLKVQKEMNKWVQEWVEHEGLKIPFELFFAKEAEWGSALFESTGTEPHLKRFKEVCGEWKGFRTEEEIFARAKIEWIEPECRETGEEVDLAQAGKLHLLLPQKGVAGVFHNHTRRSDGTATAREMVIEARRLGYQYIGISDHSQSAFYAQGLKGADLKAQKKEMNELQEEFDDIRIFWGIESDILKDGSLDYDEKILKQFDFVVASIHSRFGMDKKAMTERVCEALSNPYTTFLGHMTGRLLLDREPFEMDVERVIKTAHRSGVAIEINANPARLDIDWRYGPLLREYNTQVCINPDAHSVEGLSDTRFGEWISRKALIPQALIVNSKSSSEIEAWLNARR